ncbi:hypothetical protein [Streptomyces siamensis]
MVLLGLPTLFSYLPVLFPAGRPRVFVPALMVAVGSTPAVCAVHLAPHPLREGHRVPRPRQRERAYRYEYGGFRLLAKSPARFYLVSYTSRWKDRRVVVPPDDRAAWLEIRGAEKTAVLRLWGR